VKRFQPTSLPLFGTLKTNRASTGKNNKDEQHNTNS
jgi:hypothetical protein